MNTHSKFPYNSPPFTRPFLPVLLLLFFGSGCAALVYEIVWFQMLQLLIGSSAVSLGVLLGTYMGGLCLGSLFLPRFISPRRHPLRIYAVLEFGIGLIGIALLFSMPVIERIYAVIGAEGLTGFIVRGAISAVCLLPPTILMGATLPAAARWLESSPRGVSWLGFLYGGNTVGAVIGCFLAAFYLLRIHDIQVATFMAALINGTIALVALILAGRASHRPIPETPAKTPPESPQGTWLIYITIGLSGMCALGAEVVWTRLLSLLLGGTVYTFAIILAVFLAGIGIGSSVGSAIARTTTRPRALFGWCQILLAAAIAWTAFMISRSLPYWPIDTYIVTASSTAFQLDIVRCFWAILPPSLLWGVSFPLALAAAAPRHKDPGHLVGKTYASNTIGAIAGSLGFSLFIIPQFGTQNAQRLLIGMSVLAGSLLLVSDLNPFRKSPGVKQRPRSFSRTLMPRLGIFIFIFTVTALLIASLAKIPWELIAYGRRMPVKMGKATLYYVREGMNSSIAVSKTKEGFLNFHVGGKVVASNNIGDMRLERMLGHLPALLHPNPQSVLVVGCGAGITAGAFVLYPEIERIVICEIEPRIPETAGSYFGSENHFVIEDPRVEIVIDDARHYIQQTKETFDIITSDPIHPWLKGSAALYSKEYFQLCRERLKPGGVVTQWVPLYESSLAAVKSELATFFDVFPQGSVWSNDLGGLGYDIVLAGQESAQPINVDKLQRRLESDNHRRVAEVLNKIAMGTAVDLLSTYAGRGPDLKPWLRDAQINRDRNLRLQYLAGLAIDAQESLFLFNEILTHFRYPDDFFIATPPLEQALRNVFGANE